MQVSRPEENRKNDSSAPGLVPGMERVINEHPLISLNVALLIGVTLGWLAKRR
jgi:hypothetical protein